ncbi:MAG: glycosyltransferase [Candidatus Woesearchaeota archaeon]
MSIIELLTLIFASLSLIIALSYYMLLLLPEKRAKKTESYNSITIIIPARNEAPYIRQSIESALRASWNGDKQIIVVDDGSIDDTRKIAESYNGIIVLSHSQRGKSASINRALLESRGDLIAIVDGDSIIGQESLMHMKEEIEKKNVGGVTCTVQVHNRNKGICMWAHLEQLQNSLIRLIFSKARAIITTPGPLAMYRKKALTEVGGFSTEGFAEDADITIRLVRRGYDIRYAPKAYSKTNMPYDIKGFFRQRFRFARGMLNLFKRHLRIGWHPIDYYAFPLLLFYYLQSVIMGSLTIYQITTGYYEYFISNGIIMDANAIGFLIGWFTLYGFFSWTIDVIIGASPLTIISAIAIISSLLSYPLILIAIIKYDRKIDLYHIIPFFFLFPFWLLIMIIYILSIPEYFRKSQYNVWKKNEP